MKRKDLIIDLAKLVISAAWADGELSNEEINALKDLLFSVDDISVEEWNVLQMYIESPASDDERAEILERVARSLRTEADKKLALNTLDRLFKCDGKVTTEEQQLMDELQDTLDAQPANLFTGLSNAFRSAISKRSAAVKRSSLREEASEDYIKNTIYYDLIRNQEDAHITIDKPDAELRKLCLATGLLARIAYIDGEISVEEKEAMQGILSEDWNLSMEEADLLVEISCNRATQGLDYYRLSSGFFASTDIPERQAFLKTLFKIANAANKTDQKEIEEIRRIAQGLKLSHKDFIDAKLTISREDRNGL